MVVTFPEKEQGNKVASLQSHLQSFHSQLITSSYSMYEIKKERKNICLHAFKDKTQYKRVNTLVDE